MSDYCVVVADSGRARFFTLEEAKMPELESSPRLVEAEDLANPEHNMPDRELYSSPKSRNRAPNGGAHGYDDHRDKHNDEEVRRFARLVVERAAALVRDSGAFKVVLVAHGRILGLLRGELDALQKTGAKITELGKDVTKISADDIHEYLAKEGLLPKRKPPLV